MLKVGREIGGLVALHKESEVCHAFMYDTIHQPVIVDYVLISVIFEVKGVKAKNALVLGKAASLSIGSVVNGGVGARGTPSSDNAIWCCVDITWSAANAFSLSSDICASGQRSSLFI